MFNEYYLNEDGEKVYFHEEHGMRFEWMRAEDIKRHSRGLGPVVHMNDLIDKILINGVTDLVFLGFACTNSFEFGSKGDSAAKVVFCHNNIVYNNYDITSLKTKLNKLNESNMVFKPIISYSSHNYYYYTIKIGGLEDVKCTIEQYANINQGIMTKIMYTCEFGHTVPRKINNILSGTKRGRNGCTECGGTKPKTNDEQYVRAKERCDELGYSLLRVFKDGEDTKKRWYVEYICNIGHHRPRHDFLALCGNAQQQCGECSQLMTHSSAHSQIIHHLRKTHICDTEKTFSDLKLKNRLPYDVFIPSLNVLIEYDGEHHINHSRVTSTRYDPDRQKKDNMKTDYAIINGFSFLRISYKETHMESLKKFLNTIEQNPFKQIIQIYGEVYILNSHNEDVNKDITEVQPDSLDTLSHTTKTIRI